MFVERRLENLSLKSDQEKAAEKTVLCAWLIELKLDRLNALGAAAEGEGELPDHASAQHKVQKQAAIETYKKAEEELRKFLIRHDADLETETVYQLLVTHGRRLDALGFAAQKVSSHP